MMLLTAKSETKRYKSLHTQALSKGGFGKNHPAGSGREITGRPTTYCGGVFSGFCSDYVP